MNKIYSYIYPFILIPITLISVILCILIYFFTRNPSKANIIARLWGKALVKTAFVKVNVIKNFSKNIGNENYILMSNHQSAFDIFVLYKNTV